MLRSSMWWTALVALAICVFWLPAATAQAQPKRVPFDELPEEIKEKIREAIEQRLKERGASSDENAEQETSDDDADASDEKADKKEAEQASADKAEKSNAKALSDEVKKLKEEIQKMDAEFQYKVAKYKEELADKRLEIEKMKLDNEIAEKLRTQEDLAKKREVARLKLDTELMLAAAKHAKAKLDQELSQLSARKSILEAKLAAESTEDEFEDRVLTEEQYPDQPLKKGVLRVSDRRIELNGPIFSGAAKYVCDRIDFFNNQSTKPIFLVIDSSPGGSGMEGLQIVQAMQNSKAPVHVVVKRYAASMAAIITTLADESYAYPDAILLHHQASALTMGNTTRLREDLERIREMSARLVGEVADKLGISEEEFVKQMYENRSSGDWDLFATDALKRGWVKHVVDEIREASVRKRPTGSRSTLRIIGLHKAPDAASDRYEVVLTEETDEDGKPFVRLPRLSPLDAWYLYNPDGYFR